jgi:tRNA A-37 threonylcarbamoyl transferase component Bud32
MPADLSPGSRVLRLPGEGSFLAASDLEEETLRALLAAHRDLARAGRHLKENRGTVVTHATVEHRDGAKAVPLEAAVKEVEIPPRRRLFHALGGRSPFAVEFAQVAALLVRGVLAPRPLAASLRPRGASEFLATEFIAGAASLRTLVWEGPGHLADAAAVRRLLSRFGAWLREVHERGIWQRDMKPSNVLVRGAAGEGAEFFLIDVTRVRFGRDPLAGARRIRNLGQVLDFPREFDEAAAEALLAGYSRSPEEAAGLSPRARAALAERREERRRRSGFTCVDEELRGRGFR